MKALVIVACLLTAGCVEVTRFREEDGNTLFFADCDNPVRMQSCRAALESTCPNGYDVVAPPRNMRNTGQTSSKSGYFRCR